MKTISRFAGVAVLLYLVSALDFAPARDAVQGAASGQSEAAAPGPLADGEFKIGPPYANAAELTVKDGVPKGTLHEFTMSSQDSKIYPGLKGAYKRKAAVHVPSNYVAGSPAPFIVCQDAMAKDRLPKILDNMIHERRLPAMAAVFLASGGGDGKGSERGLEYDTLSDKYAVFVETEVLPRIEKDYKVTFTKDPEGRATMGGSSESLPRSPWHGFVRTFTIASCRTPELSSISNRRRTRRSCMRLGVPRKPHP